MFVHDLLVVCYFDAKRLSEICHGTESKDESCIDTKVE